MKARKGLFLNCLEFIGHGADVTSEYLGLIAKKGYEEQFSERALKIINQLNGIDVIDLKALQHKDSEIFQPAKWFSKTICKFSKCPVVELPESWNQYLESKSQNFKKKTKEYYRICDRDLKLKFFRIEKEKDLSRWMDELERLHKLRWKDKSRSFFSSEYKKFHRDIAQQFLVNGWLRLFFLIDGEKTIAALYCFAYNNTYYYYQSGRDPAYEKYHVGFVLINLVIQEAIKEGARVFDFLTGGESYKYRWAKRDNTCQHLLAFRNRRAYLCYHLESLISKFLSFSNYHHFGKKQSKIYYKKNLFE
jgi:CelD/BcsL family acetyltransferase involved in cellulose biosynthesis